MNITCYSKTNLIVSGLNPNITEETLRGFFGMYGELQSVQAIPTDMPPSEWVHLCSGSGFVNFVDPRCAQKAVDEINELEKSHKTKVGKLMG